MRNPIQEYEIARSLPLPALVAVMQGKSDVVSLGVAHAAIKEKTEAEIAKKGAQAAQTAQAPKIRDRDIAMAQGLAATPADLNVPMGGIVGGEGEMTQTAAGGGSVVAFQAGGTPPPTFGGMMQRQAASAPGFMDRLRQGAGALDRFATGRGGMLGPSLALTPTAANVGEQEYLDLIRKLQSMGYTAETIEAMSPEQRVAAATRGEQLPAGPVDTGGVATQSLADLETAQVKPEGAAAPAGGIADLTTAKPTAPVETSYSALMTQAKEMAKNYKPEPGTARTAKDFTQDYVDALKEGGFDFNLVKDQIEEVRKEKEALKGERQEAMNLRLIEAGLGILGGESPYAFVNIGKGATPALQGLAKDIKDLQKTRRALDKETMQLQVMQNQMAEGKVRYGVDQFNKQEERAAKLAEKDKEIQFRMFDRLASDKTQRYVADASRDVSTANLQATQLERAAKREDDRKEVALKQAAEEFKMEVDSPEKRRKVLTRAGEILQAMQAENFGAGAASDPVAAAQAEMARRGLK
jgi:hypothetical protein